ncbi:MULTISPECIES: DNA phosphorothioation system sulfurtransferase DndC [Exiguobacterium]|uniref:Sulfurtransferase DndC n=1 Tax=Exiguobacterium oxidotolerans TaxID=223958 RepID=A0A653IH51_9BACL|nr:MULTISPECIES: DNA phosphorothioation system sulfurtransferase DndC [Exiguobacterium]VWX38604.1 Sulfurtransferase DndC [Exiguobacterium oxidotolerans]
MGIISNQLAKKEDNPLAKQSKELIKRVYAQDERPWVIGYSGGKDSTLTVQLIFEALLEMTPEQWHKKIYVISSDTMVENPLVAAMINGSLQRMQDTALRVGLPLETQKVKPLTEKTFWSNIIGRGYPTPNQTFRWCTDRLKIDPADRFIKDKVNRFGEVIMVLGVRSKESQSRGNSIKEHEIQGTELLKHTTLNNAFVFAPIKEFGLDDVWGYLLSNPSPWGEDNAKLQEMYLNSSGECPLVVDQSIKESAGSCGNSRFGCWVCPVVSEDKSLTGFINSGEEWMTPLLKYRNRLVHVRDDRNLRMHRRMNGKFYLIGVEDYEKDGITYLSIKKKGGRQAKLYSTEYVEANEVETAEVVDEYNLNSYIVNNQIDLSRPEKHRDFFIRQTDHEGTVTYSQLGLGPFTLEARQMLLKELLEVQRDLNAPTTHDIPLIQEEELRMIRRMWLREGDWNDSLPQIYMEVFGTELDWEHDDRPLMTADQMSDLELLVQKHQLDLNTVKKLFHVGNEYVSLKVKRGFQKEVTSLLKQDYLQLYHEGETEHETKVIDA